MQRASHAMAEALYKSQGSGGDSSRDAGRSDTTETKDAEVVDAEYAETKEGGARLKSGPTAVASPEPGA